ncbi:MAG: magnesium chelatase [Acidobacteria bacterium]|nr:MAG: magnesium chelatase [Acidobacteriota bacterium]
MHLPKNLGELRKSEYTEARIGTRSVKDELRSNLIQKLKKKESLFPGIVGYDDTVIPEIVHAILSRHNIIFLGLRGQAKSRIMRDMVSMLDEWMPVITGCEINDNPYHPICRYCHQLVDELHDETPIRFIHRNQRFVEKLATPDVTIADMIGDVDPIKAAKGGLQLSDELTIHYGLVPRANRCIFAINELPDLAGKIQVGLFNILQEGDIQIKGYPIRLMLDIMMVFSANPEDYTARGKIITPLKDRIGSEIHTHYPSSIEEGIRITEQEAWLKRGDHSPFVPQFIREVVEEIAFAARRDKRIDKRSGVSQRLPISTLENVASSAEARGIINSEKAVAKITDVYNALPSIVGKLELEYEGELKGADSVAKEIIRGAIGSAFMKYFGPGDELNTITQWFENGGTIRLREDGAMDECLADFRKVPDLIDRVSMLGFSKSDEKGLLVAACEFILEGLCSQKKISRSEEKGIYSAAKKTQEPIFQNYDRYKKNYN